MIVLHLLGYPRHFFEARKSSPEDSGARMYPMAAANASAMMSQWLLSKVSNGRWPKIHLIPNSQVLGPLRSPACDDDD